MNVRPGLCHQGEQQPALDCAIAHDELPRPPGVAAGLNLNLQTIRNWIDAGKVQHVWLGARRVRVSALGLRAAAVDARPPYRFASPASELLHWTAGGVHHLSMSLISRGTVSGGTLPIPHSQLTPKCGKYFAATSALAIAPGSPSSR